MLYNIFPHEFVGMIPFSREITHSDDTDLSGTDFIPYGSTLLTTQGNKNHNWKGLFFDLAKFNYDEAMKHRDDMLNKDVVFAGEIKDSIAILQQLDSNTKLFMRPSEDLKQFSGTVMTAGDAVEWLETACSCDTSEHAQLKPTTRIIVSPVQDIQAEWRYFIVGGKIVSGSMYRHSGYMKLAEVTDESTIKEAQLFANKWLPAQCCVMDLAMVDNCLKVIEFNCLNSSGFYDHDVAAVFKALYEYCCSL